MQALLPLGRGLLALAIVSMVGELAARAYMSAGGYISARDLWVLFAPESHDALRGWVHRAAPLLWTYGLGPVLKLPMWALFAPAGVALLWLAARKEPADEFDLVTESAFLYDELEKQAKEEGYLGDPESPPADDAEEILASVREAEADMARDPADGSSDADAKTGAGAAPASRFPS